MKRTLLLTLFATAVAATCAQAQTLTLISPTVNDGSFESAPTAKTDFPLTTSATGTIPYWAATGAGPTNDTGTQTGGVNENGAIGAFEQYGGGGGGSIFNLVTSRPIAVGDQYTLTFYGVNTFGGASNTATLPLLAAFFYQPAPAAGTSYAYAASGALKTTTFTLMNTSTGGNLVFTQYTMSYTVTAADGSAGSDIGIALTNQSTAYYDGLDNFVLTVTPAAVPEPSTYAMLAVGSLGAILVLRRRRA